MTRRLRARQKSATAMRRLMVALMIPATNPSPAMRVAGWSALVAVHRINNRATAPKRAHRLAVASIRCGQPKEHHLDDFEFIADRLKVAGSDGRPVIRHGIGSVVRLTGYPRVHPPRY
jgi:hypothetical protein